MLTTVLELRNVVQSAISSSVFAPMSGGYERAYALLRSIEALRRDIGSTTMCMAQRLECEPRRLPRSQADLREEFDSEMLRLAPLSGPLSPACTPFQSQAALWPMRANCFSPSTRFC